MWSGIWSLAITRISFWTWVKPTSHYGLRMLVLLMWKWLGLLLRKLSSFKILGLTSSSKLGWGSYIIPIAKTVSTKIRALIHSMKFLSPELAPYLYKSAIRPCMEYCCHGWAGAPSYYLELLDKLRKEICRTLVGCVGPSLAASLESLAHHQNVASLSLFYWYFDRFSSELA